VDQLTTLVQAQVERPEVSASALGYGVAADDELLLELALDLEPVPRAPGDVGAATLLRDHALESLLAGSVEEFGAVALDVIAVSDDAARRHQEPETLLARLERQSAQIAAVQPERVEGDHGDRHLGACPLDIGRAREAHPLLEPLKARASLVVERDDLTVQEEPRERQRAQGVHDLRVLGGED